MRKLLLGTTALAAAATLSANAALADVSISGFYEWEYQSRSSNVAANDGTSMSNESEIHVKFSNKTDSGLDISMAVELLTDETEASGDNVDEASLTIAGGFGKFVLGQNDGAADNYAIDAEDVVSEETQATGTDTLTLLSTEVVSTSDVNKISYHLPAMGGLTAGISYVDSGTDSTSGDQDSIEMGVQYKMSAGGASITLGGATRNTEKVSGTADTESSNIGVSVDAGNITVKIAQATYEDATSDEKANGVGVKFKISDNMSVSAYTIKVEDSQGKTVDEEYTNTGGEIAYTIASGLTAYLNINDYDYKTGTGSNVGTTADSGTVSKLTLLATF